MDALLGWGLMLAPTTTFRQNLQPWTSLRSELFKQPTLRCDRWFERINTRPKQKGKKKAWKGKENLRESEVARSFGLKALVSRAKHASRSTLRAQRALEEAGVVFPPELSGTSIGGYRIYRKASMVDGETEKPRGPTSFRVYRKSTAVHQENTRPSRRLHRWCKDYTLFPFSGKKKLPQYRK